MIERPPNPCGGLPDSVAVVQPLMWDVTYIVM